MPQNSISVIIPYNYVGMWVFSDAAAGLMREPFVAGADKVIAKLVKREGIRDAKDGFRLMFAGEPFPGAQIQLDHMKDKPLVVNGVPVVSMGNTYYCPALKQEGWLCPALFKYFEQAPKHLYAAAQPLGNGPDAKALREQIAQERKAFVTATAMGHREYIREPVGEQGRPWWADWAGGPGNW